MGAIWVLVVACKSDALFGMLAFDMILAVIIAVWFVFDFVVVVVLLFVI